MKAILKTILAIFILSAIVGLIGCNTTKLGSSEIVVFRDVTDKHLAQPEISEIMSLINVSDKAIWNGATFRFSNLSDVSYTPVSSVKIEAANEWLSNELARKKELEKFKNEVKEILISENIDSMEKSHSSIYVPIARELNNLSKSKAQRRVMLIYSDLMENDGHLSLYSKDEFQLLKSNPGAFKSLLEERLPLEPLNGIAVYFVYQPANVLADQSFEPISEFYKNLLEEKGAKVTVSANLTN